MKALANHLILYDADCPMCGFYTSGMVKTGMLEAAGRTTYQAMPAEVCPLVNRQRATDEIALVDRQTGEVSYGIKSLFKVLANAMPVFKRLFNFKPFVWLMAKVYAFVSYNRRAIFPVKVQLGVLQPSFRMEYRLAYLLFAWLVTGRVLTAYAHLLSGLVPAGNSYREYLICGGQIIFQGIMISAFSRSQFWNYLGNMMTISLGGSLLLLPALWAGQFWLKGQPLFFLIYFMAVAGLMLLEHIRRTKILALGWPLSITWVLYRLLVLFLIYNSN